MFLFIILFLSCALLVHSRLPLTATTKLEIAITGLLLSMLLFSNQSKIQLDVAIGLSGWLKGDYDFVKAVAIDSSLNALILFSRN